MSIEIPTNMEEVAMKVAQQQVRGNNITVDQVIQTAIQETLQALLDNALDGHYDEVKWQGQALVVIDFMGEQVGQVTSETSLVDEFKANADQLTDRLAQATEQIVGGR